MPAFDGTGPQGQGPMTGKGSGYCVVRLPDQPAQPAPWPGQAPLGSEPTQCATGRVTDWSGGAPQSEEVHMPRGDRTGPMGMGPMTGRAAGYCAGYGVPGYAKAAPGRSAGFGGGRGGGRGWRNCYFATGLPGWARSGFYPAWGVPPFREPTPEQEVDALEAEEQALKSALNNIERRIQDLKAPKE